MVIVYTDGSFREPDQGGAGIVICDEAGRVRWTHAIAFICENSYQAELRAVRHALLVVRNEDEIYLFTDNAQVIDDWYKQRFIDRRLLAVEHINGTPPHRLAHKLANWARRGSLARRPQCSDVGLNE